MKEIKFIIDETNNLMDVQLDRSLRLKDLRFIAAKLSERMPKEIYEWLLDGLKETPDEIKEAVRDDGKPC